MKRTIKPASMEEFNNEDLKNVTHVEINRRSFNTKNILAIESTCCPLGISTEIVVPSYTDED